MARCGCTAAACACFGDNVTITGSGSFDDPFVADVGSTPIPDNGMPFTILSDGGGSMVAVTPGVPYTPVWDFVYNGPAGTVPSGQTEFAVNGSNQIIAAPAGTWADGSSTRRWFLFYFRIQSFSWVSPWSAGQYIAISLAGTNIWQAWIHHGEDGEFYGTFVQGVYPGDNLTPELIAYGGLALSTAGWSLTVFKMAKG